MFWPLRPFGAERPQKETLYQEMVIAWKHPAEGFYQLYKQEVDARIAKRWQALWMLRQGERLKRVKELGGVAHVAIQRWVRWYEAGG